MVGALACRPGLAYSALAPASVVRSTRGLKRRIANGRALSVGGTRAGSIGYPAGGGPSRGPGRRPAGSSGPMHGSAYSALAPASVVRSTRGLKRWVACSEAYSTQKTASRSDHGRRR